MIAEILQPFVKEVLERKLNYQKEKIKSGVAVELFNSTGDSIDVMLNNMILVSSMNNRIKLPFIEFVISSPVGEELSNDKYCEIAKEYLELMGYGDACYTIIKNDDKEHKHVHVYSTTMTMEEGKKINDSNNYRRSNVIMRSLEEKYGLQVVEKGKSSHNRTLGESQYRKYFFDVALHKALRSQNTKEYITRLLNDSDSFIAVNPNMAQAYTNEEWQIILGEEVYEQMLDVLSKGKFLNALFKDELLSVMDRLYPICKDDKEFKEKLIEENYYMRLVSDKGKSYYVYGIPERSLYFKDSTFPERYRFGKMVFNGQKMTDDEQKHYLYNCLFATLHESSSYEDFKDRLATIHIKVIEHVNKKGINGLSFMQENIDAAVKFKATDISRRLTYLNIIKYFEGRGTSIVPETDATGRSADQAPGMHDVPESDATGRSADQAPGMHGVPESDATGRSADQAPGMHGVPESDATGRSADQAPGMHGVPESDATGRSADQAPGMHGVPESDATGRSADQAPGMHGVPESDATGRSADQASGMHGVPESDATGRSADQAPGMHGVPESDAAGLSEDQAPGMPIETITEQYANNKVKWDTEINYMQPGIVAMSTYLLLDSTGKKKKKDDDELLNKKKKKKRNKGLSM